MWEFCWHICFPNAALSWSKTRRNQSKELDTGFKLYRSRISRCTRCSCWIRTISVCNASHEGLQMFSRQSKRSNEKKYIARNVSHALFSVTWATSLEILTLEFVFTRVVWPQTWYLRSVLTKARTSSFVPAVMVLSKTNTPSSIQEVRRSRGHQLLIRYGHFSGMSFSPNDENFKEHFANSKKIETSRNYCFLGWVGILQVIQFHDPYENRKPYGP